MRYPVKTAGQMAILLAGLCLFAGADWLQFRGSDNTSVSTETGLPTTFNSDSGQNVAWKAALPGRGPSGPIVVNGRVIVTAASGANQDRLHTLCFDAPTGKTPLAAAALGDRFDGQHLVQRCRGANLRPAMDGWSSRCSPRRTLFASISTETSSGFAAWDLNRPRLETAWEWPSSPLVVGQTVIVQLENQGESFVIGLRQGHR